MLLSSHLVAHGAVQQNIAINQVIQAVLESRKPMIVASINERIKKGIFHRGTFFKREIPEVKKVADTLAKLKLRVVESSKGFMVIAGEGKSEQRIELQLIDVLNGRIKVANKIVQLEAGMTYLEIVRVISSPLLAPFLKKHKLKKTSLLHPFNFFISDAQADPGERRAKIAGTLAAIISGAVILVGALEISAPLFLVAVLLATAMAVDVVYTGVYRWVSSSDDKLLAMANSKFANMLSLCQKWRSQFYSKNAQSGEVFLGGKVASLKGQELDEFQEFQYIWKIVDKIKNQTGMAPIDETTQQGISAMGCSEITEREVGKLKRTEFFGIPSSMSFFSKLRPLCDAYNDIVQCFAIAPSPFGEVSANEVSISDLRRGGGIFGDFKELLEQGIEQEAPAVLSD